MSRHGSVNFDFAFIGRTVGDARPYGGYANFAFCVFVRFGRADPSPTRVHQFCILRFCSFREGKPLPYGGASILHFAFSFVLGGQTPPLRGCINFAILRFRSFREGRPLPYEGASILHFAFSFVSGGQTHPLRGCINFDFAFCVLRLFGRTVEDARPYGGYANFAFCVFVRFGRADPVPTGVRQFCILHFSKFIS